MHACSIRRLHGRQQKIFRVGNRASTKKFDFHLLPSPFPDSYSMSFFTSTDHLSFYRASMQSPVLATVELSVRLSVTLRQCVKKTQARITKSSPMDRPSPRSLVLGIRSSSRNLKGFTTSNGVK